MLIFDLLFWSAVSGLLGTLLIFIFGIPPKINKNGAIYLIAEQNNKKEIKKYKKYKIFSYCGITLLFISYFLIFVNIIQKKYIFESSSNVVTNELQNCLYKAQVNFNFRWDSICSNGLGDWINDECILPNQEADKQNKILQNDKDNCFKQFRNN